MTVGPPNPHTTSSSTSQPSVPQTLANHPLKSKIWNDVELVRLTAAEHGHGREKILPNIPPGKNGRGNRTLWRNEGDLQDEVESGVERWEFDGGEGGGMGVPWFASGKGWV